MDDYKLRAKEKIEAIHVAAVTAAGSSKSRVDEALQHTIEAIRKIRDSFQQLWHNDLIIEGRQKVADWSRDAVQRIKDGAPPLSPMLLYEELVTLFKDRVWRRSVVIFVCGACVGALCGLCAGARLAAAAPSGPTTRALHSHADTHVMLVEDAASPAAATGEVLVRVQAFSVDPIDRCVLRGRGHTLRQLVNNTPVTVGRGFAGVVLDVGPGVGHFELGDEVWGCLSEWSGGCAAELLTLRSTRVSKRPRGLAADAAASLPWVGTNALGVINRLKWRKDWHGTRIAICNASTGEGCALTQLLSSWDAHVTAHASSHARSSLMQLGAQEFIPSEGEDGLRSVGSAGGLGGLGAVLQQRASRAGPWDAVVVCGGPGGPGGAVTGGLLKACAPRNAIIDIRPRTFITDRLPGPFAFIFMAGFITFRAVRWILCAGGHTDWLEPSTRLSEGLTELTNLVDTGVIAPVLDKVYLPQDYETALAHACSEDTIGTVVIRFP